MINCDPASMSKSKYIFLRIAWMERYQVIQANDVPVGARSYVSENADGGEVYNFYPIGGKYFGYARIQKRKNLRLQRLGAGKNDSRIDDVTIVFFSRNPETGGQRIVGWYENATLFSNIQTIRSQKRKRHPYYLSEVQVNNAYLVPEEDRLFPCLKLAQGNQMLGMFKNIIAAGIFVRL